MTDDVNPAAYRPPDPNVATVYAMHHRAALVTVLRWHEAEVEYWREKAKSDTRYTSANFPTSEPDISVARRVSRDAWLVCAAHDDAAQTLRAHLNADTGIDDLIGQYRATCDAYADWEDRSDAERKRKEAETLAGMGMTSSPVDRPES